MLDTPLAVVGDNPVSANVSDTVPPFVTPPVTDPPTPAVRSAHDPVTRPPGSTERFSTVFDPPLLPPVPPATPAWPDQEPV